MSIVRLGIIKIVNQLQLMRFAAETENRAVILSAIAIIEAILGQIKSSVG